MEPPSLTLYSIVNIELTRNSRDYPRRTALECKRHEKYIKHHCNLPPSDVSGDGTSASGDGEMDSASEECFGDEAHFDVFVTTGFVSEEDLLRDRVGVPDGVVLPSGTCSLLATF